MDGGRLGGDHMSRLYIGGSPISSVYMGGKRYDVKIGFERKPSSLVYELGETTFDGATYIDTGIDLSTYEQYTVCLDAQYGDANNIQNMVDWMTENRPYPGWALDFYDGDRENLEASYLPFVINCQNRFNAFMQEFDKFKDALSSIDYKAYIMSDYYVKDSEDFEEKYLDYALTLDKEQSTKFIIVQEFLTDNYTPLAKALRELQAAMLA